MYKCSECGLIFDTPKIIKNPLTWSGREDVCPRCDADMSYVDDVFSCDECGRFVRFDELADVEENIIVCKECYYGAKVRAVS